MPAKKTKLKSAALWYIKWGWQIFPVAPNGKEPLTPHGFKDATADPEQIEAWWSKWPDANIGLACALSGIVALDGDPSHYDEYSKEFVGTLALDFTTAMQNTPSGGVHFLYMPPVGSQLSNSPGKLPPGIDVRANGYILLAPSKIVYSDEEAAAKGVAPGYSSFYRWLERPDEYPPQPLPDHVVELLAKAPTVPPKPTGEPPRGANGAVGSNGHAPVPSAVEGAEIYAQVALDKELDILSKCAVGGRNHQLNKSAFAMGQLVAAGLLDEDLVIEELVTVALAIGLEEEEIRGTIRSGLLSGKTEPRIVPEIPRLVFGSAAHPEDDSADPDPGGGEEPTGAKDKKKKEKSGPSRIIQMELERMGYSFQLNELRDRIELADGSALHDGEQATIVAQLFEAGVKNKTLILDVILATAWANRYDPLRDFINSLEWDGTDYIDLLCGWLICGNDPIQYPDGTFQSVIAVWLKKWLIGAIGKALDGVQNPMLVLAGDQGIGKSEFARWLASPLPDYYISSHIMPDNTDHKRWLAGNFIWEVAELGSTTRKADVEALKAFLTRAECSYRVPYARNEVHRQARASFIGTVNPDNAGFLMDATGNRRFLSADILAIQWEAYTKNIDPRQLWAQAAHLYRQDPDSWKLTALEATYRDAINEENGSEDPILDAIERLYTITPDADPGSAPFVATIEIVGLLAVSVHEQTTRQLQLGIAKALRRLRITKGRKEIRTGERGYWGLARKFSERIGN